MAVVPEAKPNDGVPTGVERDSAARQSDPSLAGIICPSFQAANSLSFPVCWLWVFLFPHLFLWLLSKVA